VLRELLNQWFGRRSGTLGVGGLEEEKSVFVEMVEEVVELI
jgi:hypothetical protein